MNKFILIVSFFCFLSCSTKKSNPEKKLNSALNHIVEKIEQKHKIKLTSIGISIPNDVIHGVILGFNTNKEHNLNEARHLIVQIINEILFDINSREELKPFLIVHPMDSKNIRLHIGIEETNKGNNNHINLVYLSNGIIYFESYDSQNEKYYRVSCETYEDALHKSNL